jgi:hypothetical protein
MIDTTNVLWYSSIAVQFAFFLYLIWAGLGRNYPVFSTYLAISVAGSLAGIYFMRGADGARLPLSYTYYWLCAEPVILVSEVAVAFEVHAGMWKGNESIVKPIRPLLWFSLATALVSAALPLQTELARVGAPKLVALMHFEFLVMRYISSVLAIFLLLSSVLFVVVIREARHSVFLRHEGMLAVYFSVYTMASFAIEMDWIRKSLLNGYVVAALTLWFVLWMTVFRPQQA